MKFLLKLLRVGLEPTPTLDLDLHYLGVQKIFALLAALRENFSMGWLKTDPFAKSGSLIVRNTARRALTKNGNDLNEAFPSIFFSGVSVNKKIIALRYPTQILL